MKQTISPIFPSFLVLIQQTQITGWTSKQIWNNLAFKIEIKDRSIQQNFYRLLRKLVKEGYLYKEINIKNHRLSLFSESEKMNEYRKNLKTKSNQYHFSELKKKISELKAKKDFIEKQISSAKQALIDFPNLEIEINKRKIILAQELFQMNAYNTFLDSLIP